MPPSENTAAGPDGVPLFVDLDGTLVATDTSVEASFRLVRKNLIYALRLPLWLLRGRAYLKRRVSELVVLEPELLPYRTEFLAFLRAEHEGGRRLILATAADETYARAVAQYLGCFEAGVGSDGVTDLAGHQKLMKLQAMAGGGPFDYAGDDLEDLEIFPHARKAIIANPVPTVRLAAQRFANVERVFDADPRRAIDNLLTLRPERWALNLLVLLPLALAGGLAPGDWLEGLLAVACFCLGAAAIYIYGDLLHLAERRKLPHGERGPLAEGRVAVQRAGQAIPLLAVPAFLLAAWLSGAFFLSLATTFAVAFLATQDWIRLPRVVVSMTLSLLRVAAGIALLPALPPLWILIVSAVAGLAAGAAAEFFIRSKVGYV